MSEAVDPELQELLEAATAPLPVPAIKVVSRDYLVHQFLRAEDITPGAFCSIETAELYQMYLAWATKLEGESRVVPPLKFALSLSAKGFRRGRPRRARLHGGRDRRVILVRSEVARRLILWAKEHPITEAHRAIFRPKRFIK